MPTTAAVIGLDGAAWHLLEPLIGQGVMPRLQALRARGAWGTLESTVPTYTPPAWTTAFTGVNPGRHGIYGFVQGHAQHARPGLVHSGRVKAATIWEMANAQGARTGIYNVPLTYPPQPLDGWMVSGMMTPGYDVRLKGFVYPDKWEDPILDDWAPEYEVDTIVHYEQDWRDATLCDRALVTLRKRKRVLEELLERDPVRVLFTVLETPDRLQHVYYRYMNPGDALYGSTEAETMRPHIAECFSAMDDIVGTLEDYADGGGVIVCSDHGFTAWEASVHVNALLQQWGYLKLKPGATAMQSGVARRVVPAAKRFLPRKLARRAKGRTFAAVDWSKSRAFASPIPLQGLFINLRGREPFGIVPESDLETLKDELTARFSELRGPDGEPVTDRVWRSEEVFSGDAIDGAPDLMPVMRDHRFELDDELFHRNAFSDFGHLPRGQHHLDGMVIVAGDGVEAGARIEGHVADVCPTLLHLAGLKVPSGLDGKVLTRAFTSAGMEARPVQITDASSAAARDDTSPYSAEDEALIEESLRGLGYL